MTKILSAMEAIEEFEAAAARMRASPMSQRAWDRAAKAANAVIMSLVKEGYFQEARKLVGSMELGSLSLASSDILDAKEAVKANQAKKTVKPKKAEDVSA